MVQDKKWKLAVWTMTLASVITGNAIIGFYVQLDGALAMLGQGLGLVTLAVGIYSAANVAQKKVISENYIPEKDGRCAD
jgi:hypothetical protein